jgi:hypothetical protein
MPRLRRLSGAELVQLFHRFGFIVHSQRGSHRPHALQNFVGGRVYGRAVAAGDEKAGAALGTELRVSGDIVLAAQTLHPGAPVEATRPQHVSALHADMVARNPLENRLWVLARSRVARVARSRLQGWNACGRARHDWMLAHGQRARTLPGGRGGMRRDPGRRWSPEWSSV